MRVICEQHVSSRPTDTKARGAENRLSPGPLSRAGEGNRTPGASLGIRPLPWQPRSHHGKPRLVAAFSCASRTSPCHL
jgi:hypothetical protein